MAATAPHLAAEMGLIGEAHLSGDHGQRHWSRCPQQLDGPTEATAPSVVFQPETHIGQEVTGQASPIDAKRRDDLSDGRACPDPLLSLDDLTSVGTAVEADQEFSLHAVDGRRTRTVDDLLDGRSRIASPEGVQGDLGITELAGAPPEERSQPRAVNETPAARVDPGEWMTVGFEAGPTRTEDTAGALPHPMTSWPRPVGSFVSDADSDADADSPEPPRSAHQRHSTNPTRRGSRGGRTLYVCARSQLSRAASPRRTGRRPPGR